MLTASNRPHPEHADAYRMGAATLIIAVAVLATAWGFQVIGGYAPCPLCLQQRWAYYAAVPLLFAGLVLLSAGNRRTASIVFLLVALAFLANSGLGVFQAGAEWKYWPGPDTCGTQQGISTDAGSLLKDLDKTRILRCDEAAWRMFGLSFAGWNAVISLLLFVTAMRAAFSASAEH